MMSDEQWLRAWWRRGVSTEAAWQIRLVLLREKRRISRTANSKSRTASSKRNRQRFASRLLKKRRKLLLKQLRLRWSEAHVSPEMPREALLDGLYPQREKKWRPIFERSSTSESLDLKNFSFVDDPINTMKNLAAIAKMESSHTDGRLNFVDPLCLDIGPYLVLETMNRGMLPIFSGGTISGSNQRVLEMVGLRNALGMHFPKMPDKLAAIWPLPFRTRSPQGGGDRRFLRDQTSEVVATDVLDRLNDWLRELASVELNLEGEKNVLKMVGEGLNNAERHSDLKHDDDGSWSIAGFVARRTNPEGAFEYRCHLALLSVGATISESLQTAADATRNKMAEYVKRHSGIFSRKLTPENLQTVFALQDGVSRVELALSKSRGGTGLMDIIHFFQSLSGTQTPEKTRPRLSIVSGSTCILLKPPYMGGMRRNKPSSTDDLLEPRELWFNPANDQEQPPSPDHVLDLPYRLNGTLITMVWTLDAKFLQDQAHEAS